MAAPILRRDPGSRTVVDVNLTDKAKVPGWLDCRVMKTYKNNNPISLIISIWNDLEMIWFLRLVLDFEEAGQPLLAGCWANTRWDDFGWAFRVVEYQTSRPHPRRRVVRCRANRGRKSCDCCCCCCCCPRLSVGLLIRPWLTYPAIRQPVLDFHVTLGWYSNHSGWNPDPKRSCSTSAIEKK